MRDQPFDDSNGDASMRAVLEIEYLSGFVKGVIVGAIAVALLAVLVTRFVL